MSLQWVELRISVLFFSSTYRAHSDSLINLRFNTLIYFKGVFNTLIYLAVLIRKKQLETITFKTRIYS